MSDQLDDKIRQALSKEDAAMREQFGEESVFEQAMQLMKGRNRWINFWAMFVTLTFVVAMVICIWQFTQATEIKALLGWAMGITLSFGTVSMLKLWAWMEMEKNSTVREIKRLELQVAMLSRKLEDDNE